jgi:hypothetical protein
MNLIQLPIALFSGSIFMVGMLQAEESKNSSSQDRNYVKEIPAVTKAEAIAPRAVDYDLIFRDVDESELKASSEPQVNYFISGTDNNGFTHIAANAWPMGVYWPHYVWDYPFYWNTSSWYFDAKTPYVATMYDYRWPYCYPFAYYPYGMVNRYSLNAWERYEYMRLSAFFTDTGDDTLKAKDLPSAGLDDHDLGLFDDEDELQVDNKTTQSISIFISDPYYRNHRNDEWYDVGLGMFLDPSRGFSWNLNTALKYKKKSEKDPRYEY